MSVEYTIKTDHPIAEDSPDHKYPRGVYNIAGGHRYGWAFGKNPFIDEVKEYFSKKRVEKPRILDLGCAAGYLVSDALQKGFEAIGLDGTDAALKVGGVISVKWKKWHNKHLFLCDISRPFQIYRNGRPAKFDIITAWEVIEHIHPDRQRVLAENIHKHLKHNGIYAMSVAPFKNGRVLDKYVEGKHKKPNLHQSWKLRKQDYIDIYSDFDFVGPVWGEHEEHFHYMFENRYRGCKNVHKNSFWSTLKKKSEKK